MQTLKEKVQKDIHLKKYSDLLSKIAKIEYHYMGVQHLVDIDELINIGFQAINVLFEQKDCNNLNESYITTAVKWAIRNELRRRYHWYGVKCKNIKYDLSELEQIELREAIYKAVLSTDDLQDSEKTFEIKDSKKNPEENCEFSMLSTSLKEAVMTLPKKERMLIESKFFKEKKLCEISEEYSISQSRVSRIIKCGLKKLKKELIKNESIL